MIREQYAALPRRGQESPSAPSARREAGAARGCRSAGGVLLLLLLVSGLGPLGCSGSGPPPPVPQRALEALGATSSRTIAVAPGVTYYELVNAAEPWAVHLLRVDFSNCELGLVVQEAPLPDGQGPGRSRVTELLAATVGEGLAAVNGDFFTPEGLPVGTEVVDGRVRRIRERPALAWRPGDGPWVGYPESEGDSLLRLGWDVSRREGDGRSQVVSGFPLLLQAGERVGDLEVAERPGFAAERHPRTAAGFHGKKELLWLVVVDGRQPGHSAGMTLPELAVLLEALEVEDGINLDGGGSSVMVVGQEVVSRPSDAEGERPVVNALAVRRDPNLCRVRDGG